MLVASLDESLEGLEDLGCESAETLVLLVGGYVVRDRYGGGNLVDRWIVQVLDGEQVRALQAVRETLDRVVVLLADADIELRPVTL
eukprot:1159865-Heterocapsa_arctica.AAC.1